MQLLSLWSICHAISYCFVLLCIASYYFIWLHNTLHYKPYRPHGPKPGGHHDMHHALIICSSGAWACIWYSLITCSSGACSTYSIPIWCAVSELVPYVQCPHYMQFWSLHCICYATITFSSGMYGAYAMPPLNAIFELKKHMPCPKYYIVLLHITLTYIVILCIILHSGPYRLYLS
jgi:hypothetical protein